MNLTRLNNVSKFPHTIDENWESSTIGFQTFLNPYVLEKLVKFLKLRNVEATFFSNYRLENLFYIPNKRAKYLRLYALNHYLRYLLVLRIL